MHSAPLSRAVVGVLIVTGEEIATRVDIRSPQLTRTTGVSAVVAAGCLGVAARQPDKPDITMEEQLVQPRPTQT